MNCSLKTFFCFVAACGLAALFAGRTVAVQLTLNFVQQDSYLAWNGFFAGQPFLPQDGNAGTMDFDPANPSNRTTYQGTIIVDVDNLLAPTSIQLVSSAADADVNGKWLPEMEPYIDGPDANMTPGDFPADAVTSVGNTPTALDADYGIKIRPPGAPDVAYSSLRDMVFNITTPGVEPVNGLGEFSSLTQNFEYATGWWDYWLHPTFTAEKIRQRLEVAGGDNNNLAAAASKYTVTPLGGGLSQISLFIPVSVNDPDDTAPTSFTGQLVATAIVPEPASMTLFGIVAMTAVLSIRRRG